MTREECFDRLNGNRLNVPDVAIFITDGYPTMKVEDTLTEAENVKKAQIYIIAVS